MTVNQNYAEKGKIELIKNLKGKRGGKTKIISQEFKVINAFTFRILCPQYNQKILDPPNKQTSKMQNL